MTRQLGALIAIVILCCNGAEGQWLYNPINGHSYRLTSSATCWNQAESTAISSGGHLASISDQQENQWLLSNFSPLAATEGIWIGLYQDHGAPDYSEPSGGWRWTSGEMLLFTNWNTNEPNNSPQEDYGEFILHFPPGPSLGKWNDVSNCAANWRGIIERSGPPPSEQPQQGQDDPPTQITLDHLWKWSDIDGRFVEPTGGTVTIDQGEPTYLLTHGWDGTLDGIAAGDSCQQIDIGMSSIACAIRQIRPNANLFAWDWKEHANPNKKCDVPDNLGPVFFGAVSAPNPTGLVLAAGIAAPIILDARKSADAATWEGFILGKALTDLIEQQGALGSELHLIGHSHGGGVLGMAAQVLNLKGHPVDSLTILDTPELLCVPGVGCLVNTLKNVKVSSVKQDGQVAVFYYPSRVPAGGVGNWLSPDHPNLTNVALSSSHIQVWPAHLWIRGPNDGLPCPDNDGWFNQSVWDPKVGGSQTISFNGAKFESVLSVVEFPSGCFTEGALYEFVPCDETSGSERGVESETPGLFVLTDEAFESAATWSGTDVALVSGIDPTDDDNRVVLMTEDAVSSFFKDIVWPTKVFELTFDYMFRSPLGNESLTVYVDNKIAFYDNASSSLATGQLRPSGAIPIDQVAGTTARLNFVFRGDGNIGGSMVIDNVRTWGFVSGDLSQDGRLDGRDIRPFINATVKSSSVPGDLYLADFSGNNAIGLEDVPQFIEALLSQ